MRIGLLGTRGIPNRYGGFEEFAENVVGYWASQGHTVFVFCDLELEELTYNVSNVVRVFHSSKYKLLGQVIYDWKCTRSALSLNCDIIYHAGYVTAVFGNLLLFSSLKGKLIYNLDGLEWRRSKFSLLTRMMIRFLEFVVARSGANLVSDNLGIQDHFERVHGVKTHLIEYGVNKFILEKHVDLGTDENLPDGYDLVVARFEPENHVLEIIRTYEGLAQNLVVVCNIDSNYFKKNKMELLDLNYVRILGPIYSKLSLHQLRKNCRFYVHGHSVGGTNPSLLEAMIEGCKILAHDNCFNRDVLGEFGMYWRSEDMLSDLLIGMSRIGWNAEEQILYTSRRFNWKSIAEKHLELFEYIHMKRSCNGFEA